MQQNKLFILIIFLFVLSQASFGESILSWHDYVAGLRAEAISQGIRPAVFDAAFQNIHAPHQKVLQLDRSQPEHRIVFLKYRATRADHLRIRLGKNELKKHAAMLNEISQKYGVSTCFIVSLWGLETSYGRITGHFPVIQSLATLAYHNRRAAFFRKQLFFALHILNGDHIVLKDFKGEWAGATGQTQFLPSSWNEYAVDYDGDGKKDIWSSYPDIFASIANYLVKNGWKSGEPWAVTVSLPDNFNSELMTLKINRTVSEWENMGVKIQAQQSISPNLSASIIYPDGGPAMMVFNNFNVLMRWNHSIYYVGTVGYLAEKICQN